MESIRNVYRWLGPFEVLNEAATVRQLQLTRRFIFGLWMAELFLRHFWLLSLFPLEAYKPTGLLGLLTPGQVQVVFSYPFLVGFRWLSILVCAIAFLEIRFPISSVLACLCVTCFETILHCDGEVSHQEVLLIWATWTLSLCSVADSFGRPTPSAPLFAIPGFCVTAYALTAVNRLFQGGFALFYGAAIIPFVIDGMEGRYFHLPFGWEYGQTPFVRFLLVTGFPVVTLMEIISPLILFWPKFRWFYIGFILVFHLLCLLLMNITFLENALLLLLFIDWSRPRKPWMSRLWAGLKTFL